MNEAGHEQRALNIEKSVGDLGDPATKDYIRSVVIECYWGAAFHWIIVGCIHKHNWHSDSHGGLVARLKQFGEAQVAADWQQLETLCTGGWYTYRDSLTDV